MSLQRRVKEVRARARIQRWEYRQRDLAHGAWMRFRLVLARAREAYEIDEQLVQQLLLEGFALDETPIGLEPARTLLWITQARAATLGARRLEMRLDARMLSARWLALVAFR